MVVKLTRDFEHELKDMALISSSDDKDDRLSNFALNIEIHFASKKKNYILATVRKLIVQSNFKVLLVNKVNSIDFLPCSYFLVLYLTKGRVLNMTISIFHRLLNCFSGLPHWLFHWLQNS